MATQAMTQAIATQNRVVVGGDDDADDDVIMLPDETGAAGIPLPIFEVFWQA